MKINVKEVGVGDPINPYDRNADLEENEKWKDFAKEYKQQPALFPDAKTLLPVGEYEVELVWQYENEIDEWYSVPSVRYDEFETFEYYKKDSDYWNIDTRQVYIASVAPEKENMMLKPVTSKLIERDALARAKNIVFGPGNNNYGRDKPINREPLPVEKVAPESKAINRDWTEDLSHENGNYMCHCGACGNIFNGHKRRVRCKVCATLNQPEKEVDTIEQEWIAVDPDLDIYTETNLQSYEQYFIVVAETGKVEQAVFISWETEGVEDNWVVFDKEYSLTYASHYQPVVYPNPPKQLIKPQ